MELKTLFWIINVIYVKRCIKLIEKYPDHATFKHIKCVTMATDLLSIDSPLYMRVFGYIVQYHRKHLCKEFVCIYTTQTYGKPTIRGVYKICQLLSPSFGSLPWKRRLTIKYSKYLIAKSGKVGLVCHMSWWFLIWDKQRFG